ncbi:hypothetical protein HDU98_000839 [Podochytrium sp. JEL0797]|nr:hypothetical protein HDU98_000839 [Podochytrium sp. JEL0797]
MSANIINNDHAMPSVHEQATPENLLQRLADAFKHLNANQNVVLREIATLHSQAQPQVPVMHNETLMHPQPMTETSRPLPIFNMPSVKPLTFDGNFKNHPAHELQNILDNYLNHSLEHCILYNFATGPESVVMIGQPTYAQFTSSGLTNNTRVKWRHTPESQRVAMTWNDYHKWIQDNFGSSASLYSVKFNEPELFHIDNDFNALQKEEERLDDVMFLLNKNHSGNVTSVAHPRQQSFPSFCNAVPDVNDPKDLSNVQQQSFRKLTPKQKQLFRQKRWCIYCQSHKHDTNHCSKLQARCQSQNLSLRSNNSNFTHQNTRSSNSKSVRENKVNSTMQVSFDEPESTVETSNLSKH